MINIKVDKKLGKVLKDGNYAKNRMDYAIEASAESTVVREYVRQTPVNIGNFRQGIELQRKGPLKYVVASTAKSNGRNYPYFLYTGTGKLRGAADYGYTAGRVRGGSVARGIGGIRPNKAAKRAKEASEGAFLRKLTKLYFREINK